MTTPSREFLICQAALNVEPNPYFWQFYLAPAYNGAIPLSTFSRYHTINRLRAEFARLAAAQGKK